MTTNFFSGPDYSISVYGGSYYWTLFVGADAEAFADGDDAEAAAEGEAFSKAEAMRAIAAAR
jgi:hypothetical protein